MGRAFSYGFAAVTAVLSMAALASAQGCLIEPGRIDCRQAGNGGGSTAKDDSFWTGPVAQTIYALGGLAVTGAAGVFATNRVRSRRRRLSDFLVETEKAYAAAKTDPAAGIPRLSQLRLTVRETFERGRFEDAQFLELDKRIGDYLARLRMLDLQQRFDDLPPALMAEITHLFADGNLSVADVSHVEKRAVALRVPTAQRTQLLDHLRRWSGDHAVVQGAPRRRLALVARP